MAVRIKLTDILDRSNSVPEQLPDFTESRTIRLTRPKEKVHSYSYPEGA